MAQVELVGRSINTFPKDWRGQADAKHVAVALYHHFHRRPERDPVAEDADAEQSAPRANVAPSAKTAPPEDWTLLYITIHQQSLVEALDVDLSALILQIVSQRFANGGRDCQDVSD